jgi:hypothetical protein
MPEIRDLLDGEVRGLRTSDDALARSLRKAHRHAARQRLLASVLALAISAAGISLAARTFLGDRTTTPSSQAPNYEMEATLVGPDDERPNAAVIRVQASWDPSRFPGVRYCSFEALDSEGVTVGEVRDLYAPHVATSRGQERFGRLVFPVSGEAASTDASCEPERLDAPGITELTKPPKTNSWKETLRQLERRTDAWAEDFQIRQMSVDELAGNMWALWLAIVTLPDSEDDWVRTRELGDRLGRLCVLLPPGHEFRGGEFCD